jgi:prepilin-type N-terminal cleavage/methylation domain-containing protein
MAKLPHAGARPPRGVTLLEAMLAMAIVAIGATGTIAAHLFQVSRNAEARRISEATALAQDLVENMSLWAWNDVRLTDTQVSNNDDLGDTARAFEGNTFVADHAEADLATGPSPWTGLPARAGFERYWNVARVGTQSRIAVIVRWPQGSGWRRVVAFTSRADMSGVAPP